MKPVRGVVLSLVTVLLCSLFSAAQQSAAAANASVPPLIPFSSLATDEGGSSLSGVVNITFSLYAGQQGGAPLWTETQNNIQLDPTGHFSVQLGITRPNGVPTTLFTTTEARWLGVRIAEQVEQPRVLLLSVPYALKAGDAATIGGLPPSAFVLAAPSGPAAAAPTDANATTQTSAPPPTGGAVTGTGTVNFLPLWDTTSDIISSVLFQSGTGATSKIGINTTTPATTLDIKGSATVRGTLSLPATGTATVTKATNSQPMTLAASAFNTTSGKAVAQTFQWQAEPVGNDTATNSATLNLLFGSGTTKPAETGLNIASTGVVTFNAAQTFPNTLSGVTTATGSGLTGGGTSGTLNLGLLNTCTTNQVLQWNGTSWVCASAGTGTVTSVASGAGLTGGPITGTGSLSIATGGVTNAMLATSYAQLGAANTFAANQTVNGTLTATSSGTAGTINATTTNSTASAVSGDGVGSGVFGTATSTSGVAVEGYASATSGLTVGVFGQTLSTSGNGVQGSAQAATGTTYGVQGVSNSPAGFGVFGANNAATGNAIGVYGTSSSNVGYGVEGNSPNIGVYGTGSGAGVSGQSSSATAGFGVEGNSPFIGVYGTGLFGVAGLTSSAAGAGVEGIDEASSGGLAGVFEVFNSSATILQGNNGSTTEFKVDSAGNVSAAGAVSGSGFQIGGQLFDYGNFGFFNAFLGFGGNTTMTGTANTAVGFHALPSNSTGSYNTASGVQALFVNSTGSGNTATGYFAGSTLDGSNVTGSNNTAMGYGTAFSTGTLTNATAIGYNAYVGESNALVLGSGANVGIGTSTPGHLLDVAGTVAFDSTGLNNGSNFIDLTFGLNAGEGMSSSRTAGPNQYGIDLYTDFARRISIEQHGNVGIGTTSPDDLLTVNGSADKPGGGSWGTFSDGRLKTVNGGFTAGLSQVMKIHPVHYRYKPGNAMGIRDTDEHVGVVAQEVQKVIPEAVTENSKGYLLVNNDPIIWTMLNAIKEQQGEVKQEQAALAKALRQIKQQQSLLRAQGAAMRSLKAEVRETRESLRKVKAQVAAAQPALVAAK